MNSCTANTTLTDVSSPTILAPFPNFTDTVLSSALLGYIIASSLVKSMTNTKDETSFKLETSSSSRLFNAKVVLTLFLAALAFLRHLLYGMILNHEDTEIMASYLHFFVWPISLTAVLLGRRTLIPAISTRDRDWILPTFWIFVFINENLILLNFAKELDWSMNIQSPTDKLGALLFSLRYIFTLILCVVGLRNDGGKRLLPQLKRLGSVEEKEEKASAKKPQPFEGFSGKLKMFTPFLWPKGSPLHQFCLFVCLLLEAAGRYLTLMRPLVYKALVDSLLSSDKEQPMLFRWDLVLGYVGAEFFKECLTNLRSGLWERVEDFTVREVEMNIFRHLHKLSLGWHLSKKTGEVLEVSSRGASSAQHLLSHLLFTILPSIADICIAMVYFVTVFNIWFGIILFTTGTLYIAITYFLTHWVSKFTEEIIQLYPAMQSTRVDSLLNFETVKCYNNEEYEISKYNKTLTEYKTASIKQGLAYDAVHLSQKAITTGGLLAGSLLCVYMITTKQGMTLGDFVLFAAYAHQFFAPMYAFGGLYRFIQRSFKEMKKMYDVLNEEEDVKDLPGAPDLAVTQGQIEFRDVSFSYRPEKPVLRNISFVIHPGQTIAFVGSTGSGKTTIARLLFRLYNLQKGDISIDGQSITQVTQKSVRRSIGVVPQDTVLFNEDIRFNIRYGKLDASDEEVEKAAIAAEIHDTVLRFPDGYKTKVGERGLKLSGGEKQRIAIARTILKSAPITLLDEATSALDTQTERSIQASLNRLCACKTTVIIAHRLSTVIHAHQICVLKEGEIVERGTHEELLELGKAYSSMWQSQMKELSNARTKPSEDKSQPEKNSN